MRYNLLLIALFKIGSLMTESIEFGQRNEGVEFPFAEGKLGNDILHPMIQNQNKKNDWNEKLVHLDNNQELEGDNIELPDENEYKSIEQLDDVQLARFSNYLIKLLQRPGIWEAPLILVKDSSDNIENRPLPIDMDGLQDIEKRSRYYRRYPWKRQNPRSYNNIEYDPYNPCNPTRNDVFQLLVALHDARQGNKSRVVNFCNRRRPASAVYTNIRFLGRKKK